MKGNSKGFTLVELIVIIVVIGILVAVAIPRYVDLTAEAANGTARGVLGALRSQNSLMFGQRIIGGTAGSYNMLTIARSVAELKGFTWTASATQFTMTAGGRVYTFTLNPTPNTPATYGTIYSATTTW